jgi:hypothetical protein
MINYADAVMLTTKDTNEIRTIVKKKKLNKKNNVRHFIVLHVIKLLVDKA